MSTYFTDDITDQVKRASSVVKDQLKLLDYSFEALHRLETLREVIRDHGATRPLLEVSDPGHELPRAGKIASYESFSLEADPQTTSQALEALSETLKEAWSKLIGFLRETGRKIAELARMIQRGLRSQEAALNKMNSELNSLVLDPILVKTTECRTYTNTDWESYIKAFGELITVANHRDWPSSTGVILSELNGNVVPDFNKIGEASRKVMEAVKPLVDNEEYQKILGLSVQLDKGQASIESISRTKPSLTLQSKTLDAHGLDEAAIRNRIRSLVNLVRAAKATERTANGLVKRYNEQASTVEKQLRDANSFTDEELKARRSAVGILKEMVSQCTNLVRAVTQNNNNLFNACRATVTAAKKAKKKEKETS